MEKKTVGGKTSAPPAAAEDLAALNDLAMETAEDVLAGLRLFLNGQRVFRLTRSADGKQAELAFVPPTLAAADIAKTDDVV